MNPALVDSIVNAVLYEGYLLYPYRPSVKNRRRWTFGVLYPPGSSEASGGSDACSMQTECLVRGGERTTLEVRVRFLHLLDRRVGELARPRTRIRSTAQADNLPPLAPSGRGGADEDPGPPPRWTPGG